MLLNKIKLSGFKSFVEPTEIKFSNFLTGIVGPNGCGKSNIVDAVKWVLGESRNSELRGENSRDVIFSGSSERSSAGRASVELIFDNSSGKIGGLWGSYSEISVQRILSSDGNSSSLINGQLVRRKDVLDLFMGTGLGPRAYAIVGQGSIGKIIDSKPEDLRSYLEEAAGVSKYRSRRKETENRLRDTKNHLQKVSILINELEDRKLILDEQAKKADFYKQKNSEKNDLELALLHCKFDEIDQFLKVKEKHFLTNTLEVDKYNAELSKINLESIKLREEVNEKQKFLDVTNQSFFNANSSIATQEKDDQLIKQRLDQANKHILEIEKEIKELDFIENNENINFVNTENSIKDLHEDIKEINFFLNESKQKIIPAEKHHQECSLNFTESKTKVALLEAEKINLGEKKETLSKNIAFTISRSSSVNNELKDLESKTEKNIEELKKIKENAEVELSNSKTELAEEQKKYTETENKLNYLKNEFNDIQKDLLSLEAQKKGLLEVQSKFLGSEKVNDWLKKINLNKNLKLISLIKVNPKWKLAVESVLDKKLASIQLKSIDQLKELITQKPPSSLNFFISDFLSSSDDENSNIFDNLSSAIISENEVSDIVKNWLKNYLLAESFSYAIDNLEKLNPNQRFVTHEGHIVGKNNFYFFSENEESSLLSREEKISYISKMIDKKNVEMNKKKNLISGCLSNLEVTKKDLESQRLKDVMCIQKVHAADMKLAVSLQRNKGLLQRKKSLEEDLSRLSLDKKNQDIEFDDILKKILVNNDELEKSNIKLSELQKLLDLSLTKLNKCKDELKVNEEKHNKLFLDLHTKKQFIENLNNKKLDIKNRKNDLDNRLKLEYKEKVDFINKLNETPIKELILNKQKIENQLNIQKRELEEKNTCYYELEKNKQELEKKLEPVKEQIRLIEMDKVALLTKQNEINEKLSSNNDFHNELSLNIKELIKNNNVKKIENKIKKIDQEINDIGAVNLAAIDEINSVKERGEVLTNQINDITMAEHELIQAIKKIDIETRELLTTTFETVNKNLKIFFPKLFGGGVAKLVLSGEEILDATVQIQVQPPGKKTNNIHLLSGGEKALSAVALIFSFFQLNPAPFCFLDEVDAPLDDSNTNRLNLVIKELSQTTQFIFVTHNKISMEIGSQLVGITMKEPGVSRVVSVDIDSAVAMAGKNN